MEREKAIEIIKQVMPTLWKETKDAIQTLIPELAENEDEKIREELLQFFHQALKQRTTVVPKENYERWIAYLEKKKEQKLVTFEEPCNSDEYEVVEIGNATCLRRKEQKPAEQIEESEEKSIGTTLIDALKGNAQLECALKRAGVNVKKLITYLEQKEQKSTEWSEEDNRILYNVISYIGFAAGQRGVKNNLFKEANDWLKSFPERFELPSKQEWSEEDRKMLNTIISDGSRGVELDAKQVNFLKSLCPQYRWKPSKEQMDALYNVEFKNFEKFGPILNSLYNDLKKL